MCGCRNSLSMRYGDVSGWGVERKCHSMVERYEKGSTMGMRQRCSTHCFCPIWIFRYGKQHWHSCQGTVLSPSWTVHWTSWFTEKGYYIFICQTQWWNVLWCLQCHWCVGSYVCHFCFCFCQRLFLKVTLSGIWNKSSNDNCHHGLWHGLDLVPEKHFFLNRWQLLPSLLLHFSVAEVSYTGPSVEEARSSLVPLLF